MRARIFQVDAFAKRLFAGNPAAVVLLEDYLADGTLQAISAENNLAETAFIVPDGDSYHLRWFTPQVEVPLCGHATLASGAVVLQRLEPSRNSVTFQSASGPLSVTRREGGLALDLPVRPYEALPIPEGMAAALSAEPDATFYNPIDRMIMAVFDDVATVRNMKPDMALLSQLDCAGVLVTAAGDEGFDFVSRYFAPAIGIPEDPVTGGAHCMLTPYWSRRLNVETLRAYQASSRGGEIMCRLAGDRIDLTGSCVFYLEGTIEI